MVEFQTEAAIHLVSNEAKVESVEKCLRRGEGLHISALPEVLQLRARLEELTWLKKMEELLEEPKMWSENSEDIVRALEGAEFAHQSVRIQAALARLRGLSDSDTVVEHEGRQEPGRAMRSVMGNNLFQVKTIEH